MGSYVAISYWDLALAAVLVLIAVAVSWVARLDLERDLIVGTLRASVQLLAVGLVLEQIFSAQRWYWVVLALTVMVVVAGSNAAKRQKGANRGLAPLLIGTIGLGGTLTLALVIGVVLRVRPWYEPRYVIPIAGMIFGNAMTAAALVVNRLRSEILLRRHQVEAALALGASPRQATQPAMREALRSAMLPTITSMMTVGIVQLPGMMTGQIIAGANPSAAVRYQIVVMVMVAAATAMTAISSAFGSLRLFFTPAWQLSESIAMGPEYDRYMRNRRNMPA